MAINYAAKHAKQIDERFTAGSVTDVLVNKDYDFTGVKTVQVHSVPTVAMNDYQRSGANRYGQPAELEDVVQEMTMSQDKSFTFTVDKGNSEDDAALNAGTALNRQLDEVIIPMVDRYRLKRMADAAGHRAYAAITKANAYEKALDLNSELDDDNVPDGRRICVSGAYYKLLKQDSSFVKSSDLGMETLISGQIGEIDGVPVVRDRGRLPKGVAFIITHPLATTAPHKIAEYKLHQDPPGISGALVEGRDYFDAFVLNEKACAVAVHYSELMELTAASAAGASGKTKISVSGDWQNIGQLVMKTHATSVTAPTLGADISTGWTAFTPGAEISATSGHKAVIALRDKTGKCIGTSAEITLTVGT